MNSVKLTKLAIPVDLKSRANLKLTRNYLQKTGASNDYIVYHTINKGELKAELSLKQLDNGNKFIAFQNGEKDRFQAMLGADGKLLAFSKTGNESGRIVNPPKMFENFQTQIIRVKKLFRFQK